MAEPAVCAEALARLAKRALWAPGDHPAIAREMFWDVGARVVDRVGVEPGERVLDVACGPGNVALPWSAG